MKRIAGHAAVWIALAIACCAPAAGAQPSDDGGARAAQSVDRLPPAATTYVTVRARLLDLERVPDSAEADPNFDASFWIEMRWSDPRLAFDGQKARHYLEHDAQTLLEQIWDPQVAIDDEEDDRERLSTTVSIAPDGQVTYQEKFRTRVSTTLNLRAFPFDTQHFKLAIVPDLGDSDVVLKAVQAAPASEPQGHPAEWRLLPESARIETRLAADGSALSTFVLDVPAQREGSFYIVKIMLPLIVIVVLSWANFWVTGKGDGRIRLTFVCLLAVVAYQNVLSRYLPRLTFLTFTDWIILFAQISLALTVVENAWVHQLLLKDETAKANRIDRRARWLIPLTVSLGVVAIGAMDFL